MGWLARAIDAGIEYRKPLADLEDDLFLDTGTRRAKSTKFWVQLALRCDRRRRRDRRLHAGGDRRDDHRAARHAHLRDRARDRHRRPA